jgi:opacity protein-like surface antigen
MKKLVTAFVLATLLSVPAIAKQRHQAQPSQRAMDQAAAAQAYVPGNEGQLWIDNQTVVTGGHAIGRDPDPNVRQRMILDGDLTQLSD